MRKAPKYNPPAARTWWASNSLTGVSIAAFVVGSYMRASDLLTSAAMTLSISAVSAIAAAVLLLYATRKEGF